MSQNLIRKYEQRLKTYYEEVNQQNNEHINKQNIRKWLMLVINDKEIIVYDSVLMIKQRMGDQFDQWIEKYLKQVVGLQTEKVQQVEFAYDQCVEFLQWLMQQFQHKPMQQDRGQQIQNGQQQRQQEQDGQIDSNDQQEIDNNEQGSQNNDEKQNLEQQQKEQEQKRQQEQHYQRINDNKLQQYNNSPTMSHKTAHEQQNHKINEFSQHLTNSQPVNSIIDKLKHKSTNHQQQNIMKLPQQDQRYKQYLQTIFEHYCKINFGLAKDNTFQSMQKHVSIITINKFMIFVNDFQVPLLIAASMPKQGKEKPNKIQIRNLLMDVFKKNSQFHKQMDFQQFIQAINKIGQICFTQMKQHQYNQNQQKTTKFSYQMVKMLKYLQISNFKEFKQKMTKLNINFSLRFNKLLQEKKVPVNYKFKYDVEQNKKTQLFAKPPMPTRKNSQKKDGQENFKKHKPHLQITKPPLNSKMSTPHIPKINSQNKSVGQRKGGSTKILPSQFTHNTAQNQRKDRNIIPFQNTKKNGKSVEKFSKPTNPPQPVIQGYVNIHLAKKGLLSLDQNKNSLTGIRKKGDFQLNNVIEEARKQTQAKVYYDYQDSRSGRAMSNLSRSKPLSQYSREPVSNQSQRNQDREDIQLQMAQNDNNLRSNKRINTNNQAQLQKSRLDPHNQLRNLIDFNESDEDQYLDQHLKKEKDHDTQMGMRVEKKISQFNYKI